jgi:cohesin complex subunit SA-1/2
VKAPEKFSPEPPNRLPAPKRKRGTDHDEGDVENEELESDSEMSDDVDDDDDADAGMSRRKKSQAGKAKKPAAKKPKTNGAGPHGTGHAANLPSRPKKSVRIAAVNGTNPDGLYGTSRFSPCLVWCAMLTLCYSRYIWLW